MLAGRHAVVLLAALATATRGRAQPTDPVPSDVTFSLRRAFLDSLATSGPNDRTVGARWTVTLAMGEHSGVHPLDQDCELHVAARPLGHGVLANPAGIVVEPPNVCKRRVPQIAQTGPIAAAWIDYFNQHVTHKQCDVTGFPRIFSEHSSGGTTGGSNPDHVLELHPAIGLTCGAQHVDLLPLIHAFPGMRHISDASAVACLEERKLFVRQRGSTSAVRYEFLEEGAKTDAGRCGNFVIVDAHIGKEYLRALTNGGDHVALARVWVGESGPYPLKIYTYAGTPEDDRVAALMANDDDGASIELRLHGLFTYDYFTILQAVQDEQFAWLPGSALKDYREISHPLALIVFGRGAPPQ
ncbi:hypothetical protein J421_5541 (plasmid) [Gemmatirosa kalamazoonensis]|uniref:Uncharacterized protein n=1 Tax=Gemmatirosa kalamazoonensis TaxID=861299 RepID=W0RQT6_9BACT|nr:hypothetical protein [Gemmatirosa kalamazoonensis]AHG93076.1 hypothetical protein J421_5541 [Gemmatirosa kalamazoonensis]